MLAQQRPTGVTVIAVISAILGILAILGGLLLVLGGALLGGLAVSTGGPSAGIAGGLFAGIFGFFGILILIIGIVDVVFAYGAWTLKPWAWILGIVIGSVSIVFALLSLSGSSAATQIITIALWAVVIYYLNTPLVKQAFGRA